MSELPKMLQQGLVLDRHVVLGAEALVVTPVGVDDVLHASSGSLGNGSTVLELLLDELKQEIQSRRDLHGVVNVGKSV